MAKLLRLDVAQLTDVGRRREHNEDNMAYVIPKDPQVMAYKGALFIVADGMGGHAAGEVASEIAVDTVSNAYYQDDNDDVAASLLQAIRRANAAIHQRAGENMLRSGMGTTCVAAVLRGNMAYVANVGDSRAYLVRRAYIRQVSQDHSWVAEQVRAGLLTEEQARTHTQRNVITRSLGTQTEVEIDLFREVLEEGDTLLLCSDGLSGMVNDDELQQTAEQFVPQESVYHLIERANENGGSDNITAVVARVQELGVEPPNVRQPVSIGGPELSNEDTARLFASVGAGVNMAARSNETPVQGSPFPYVSSPLASEESDTAPQSAFNSKKRHNRLFAPTLTLAILFILAAAGSGFYYFLHTSQAQTITSTLNEASQLISQANTEASRNPAQALQNLSQAQQKLQNLPKNYALSNSANSQLITLQNQLVSEAKTAITNYDQAAHITLLPCTTSAPSTLNQGIAQTLALLQNSGYYALGQGGQIYQLNSNGSSQYSLSNPFSLSTPNTKITNIVGANSAIFALSQQTSNGTPGNYTINMLTPGSGGVLQQPAHTQSIGGTLTQNGQAPGLITAWSTSNGTNIYVVLTSSASNNSATILSYNVDNKGNFNGQQTTSISVSHPILSIAATADRLFMLLEDGSLVSTPSNAISSPTSVLIDQPIATPLSAEAQNFTTNTTVPAVTPTAQSGSSALTIAPPSLSNPATLSAGMVTGPNGPLVHLFISDPSSHRVLDLTQQAAAGGPGSVPTANVTLSLAKQYVSPTYFNSIKSVAVDPNGGIINILGQNAAKSQSLVQVSTSAQNACAS